MWCANRRRKQQIFADGEMFVERILLRHITDVVLQGVEIFIERLPIEDHFPARRLQLAGQHPHERAFSRTARTHYANQLTTRDVKGDSLETNLTFPKAVRDFVCLYRANDIAPFLDAPIRKTASHNTAAGNSNAIPAV